MGYKMRFLLLAGVVTISLGMFFVSDYARADAGAAEALVFRNKIADYNRLKPLQNPRYVRSSKILKRRVADSKNKVIGEVNDILFNQDGQVESLYVDFDRLNLGKSVYLNYDTVDIKSVSSGYRLGFNSDEVETLYPALLSGIETASGDAGNGDEYKILSLKDVLGSTVIDSDGLIIGKLEDILFDSNGTYVRSVYLNINYQTIHNKGVAVPISVLGFEDKHGKLYVVIDKPYVKPILEMAKEG